VFGIGGAELFLILIFLFLIVGPERLPQMGRTIGRAIRQFKNAQDEVNKVIQKEVVDPFKQVDQDMRRDPFAGAFGDKKADDFSAGRAGSTDYAAMQGQGGAGAAPQEEEETFAERKARMAKQKEEARARKQAKKEAAMAKKKADKEKAKAAGEAGEASDSAAEAVEAAAPAAAVAAATHTTPARKIDTGVRKVEPETPVISQKNVPSVAASLYGLPSTPVKRATFGKPAAAPAPEAAPSESGKGGEADA